MESSASFTTFPRSALEGSLLDRFEEHARARDDHLAVKTTSQSLTYSDLNRSANGIAWTILDRIGEGNDPVALLIRSEALSIAAIIGALKAGKIYVPLDPTDSAERNARVIEESAARLLLSDLNETPRGVDVLNPAAPRVAPRADNPGIRVAPGAMAYIYYTSGSTGRPKGVVDTHRNVLHNVMRYTNSLRISRDDRLTLLQSPAFSGAVSSLFCALLNGATSYPFDIRKEGATRLADWVADERLTMYHSVPSIFRLIATGARQFPALRVIRLEGDRARPIDIELFKKHFADNCVLVNGLGATECGLVRQYFVGKTTVTPPSVVPIGYPVDDMTIRLSDDSGNEVAPSEIGEIAVESEYLAHGYWRRPDLTDAAFVPAKSDPKKRVYRTGDVGRMHTDGCLEYLGRKNFQCRIRGQWVDLAEVEAALMKSGWFSEAIVQTVERDSAESILAAYLVARSDRAPTRSAIRQHLRPLLAEHMIPASYTMLDHLPTDANGKIDRRALPALDRSRAASDVEFVAPISPLQTQLQQIWQDVLKIRPIGILDDFFELGGDSLAALAMITAVERIVDRRILPDSLLANSTIERLAEHLQIDNASGQSILLTIQPGTRGKPLFFLHGDYEGGGMYARRIARALGPEIPFYALPPCGKNGVPCPGSYQEMADIHWRAVRERQPHGPYILGGTCNGGLVAFEMARLIRAAGEQVDLLILIGASASNLRSRWLRSLLVSTLSPVPQGREIGGRIFGHFIGLRRIASQLIRVTPRRNLQTIRNKLSAAVRSTQRHWAPAARSSLLALAPKYQQIDRQYMPSRFAGKVTLFWSASEAERPQAAARAWRMVADDVELHVLPGEHHEKALSEHEAIVAGLIKSCIQAVESGLGKVLPAAGNGNDRSEASIDSTLAAEHG